MSQASKSHPEDALGKHSRKIQTPEPANSQPGTTSDCDEAKGGVPLKRPEPGHVGPGTRSKPDEALKGSFKREQVRDAKEIPGGMQRALKAGPHGKAIHADGSSQAESKRRSK